MTSIVVIGGTGYAGSAIVREAAARGHRVTAVSRSRPAAPVEDVTYVQATAEEAGPVIAAAEVVVAALSPRGSNAGTLPQVYRRLAGQAAEAGARFIAVGGFSSLRPVPGAPRVAEGDDLPAEFAGEAREMHSILIDLEGGATDGDWLFVSPAAEFGAHAPGEDRGGCRVGGDVALADADGRSALGAVDFGRAVVDEIETPTRHRAQISFAY